jgi:putative nucleotidyltransferase with HDIG domain
METLTVLNLESLLKAAYELEPLSSTTSRLAQMVARPDAPIKDIITLINYDQALTVKVLRAANSVYSAPREPITSIQAAVVRIGTGQVLSLATAANLKGYASVAYPEYGLSEGEMWEHSVMSAVSAESLNAFCDAPFPPESFTAALLHDVGKLILARFLEDKLAHHLTEQGEIRGVLGMEAERRVLGVHHGDVGGLVARKWQLPDSIVNGIVHHHTPEDGKSLVCDVVHLAEIVADTVALGEDAPSTPPKELNPGSVTRLGFRVEGFPRLCERVRMRFDEVMSVYES